MAVYFVCFSVLSLFGSRVLMFKLAYLHSLALCVAGTYFPPLAAVTFVPPSMYL